MGKFSVRKFPAIILAALTACGGNAALDTEAGAPEQSGIVADTDGVPPEATVFPIGVSMNAPQAFTGGVWLSQLIPNEETYNFPQTNSVTFEPGARSAWHTHGGMVILASAGTGYYQEED